MDPLQEFFSTQYFMPHGHCYQWTPAIVWLQVLTNLTIGVAYVMIALTLAYIIRRVDDIPFKMMYVAFGVFIISCGFTHFFDIYVIWTPAYWMDVSVRGVTAVASMGTALMLFPLIPKAVSLAHGAKAAHTRGIKLETMVDELATAYEKTREIEQLKSDFFANVSHELRTPLSLIIGPSEEIAHAENLTDKQRRDMGVILRNARGLLLHVNDLLDVASLDAGRLEIKRSDHADIRHIVALQASNFETLADANDIDFQVDLPETLTGRVDEEKIGRVVLNLLSNAFKFTPKGGKIRCTLFTRNGDVVLEVADSGPGIPVKNREQVFERFRQLEGGSTRRFGGTGLGLVIVKDFVELHGGTIRIDDAPEGGALLVMELPATVTGSEAETSPEFEPITPAITPPTEELPPQTDEIATDAPLILIVEDNPEMNRFVSEALAADYRVLCAHDGAEGLKMTLEHRPDLIISDVMMPVMSGDQFVRAVRTHAEFDDMPIIMLTAKADDEMRITLLREGAQDYVMKPFSVEELRLRASNLIMITQAVKMMREELQTASGDLEELTTALMTSKTELRHTLEAVTIAREQAENASRLKSGFLGLLSHELRTPLTSMQLYAELLEHYHDQIPDEVVDVIERMQAAIKRMTDLVEGLLQQATIESGQLQVKLETIDVGPVIDEVAESVRPTAERKGLELAVNIDPDLPPVQTDRRLLRLIASNLLVNAVKFTEKGSVEVRLELRGEAMRLSVIDTGPGIGPEDQVRIFQPFEQLEFIRRKHSAGVGLGLSLVREMVELLQGTIEVESTVRAGSTFLVCLPIISDNH